MDVKEAISKRRSIRKYQRKEVPLDLIRELIDAARLAPSGSNAQPCRYYLVKDKETREKLKENQIFEQDFVYQAPVLIVCCSDLQSYRQGIKGWSEENENRATEGPLNRFGLSGSEGDGAGISYLLCGLDEKG